MTIGMGRALFVLVLVGLLAAGCIQMPPVPPTYPPGYEAKDYCQKDSDCVRQGSCCDCGLGVYVNTYHLNTSACNGPRCMCAIALSKGECQLNRCVAVPTMQLPG